MPTAAQLRERLVGLLSELFQLNQPDLDFGFWRIMHAKSREVTDFLQNDLLKIVADAFGQDSAQRVAGLQKAYEDAVAQAKSFGAPDPEQTAPVKEARAALDAAADTSKAEGEVYDHLFRFFERYYADGDFLSRRYHTRETPGKAAPYAVPYDGSEVYLHWANKDQYYIKTSEYFTNFTFDPTKAPEVQGAKDTLFGGHDLPPLNVEFRIVAAAEGEHGNVKASAEQKRFFILRQPEPVYFEGNRLVVGFEFRPDPDKTGQDRTWQEKRCAEAVQKVLAALDGLAKGEDQAALDTTVAGRPVADLAREYAAVLRAPAPTPTQKDRTLLAKYVKKYADANTMDYFIHKDLGGFLQRELDFYLKNEVMRLDDIESADAPRAERYLGQVRVLRQIAHKIIAFLAQLEDFQKRLWLKKKFVVETDYCITMGNIDEAFYPEIAACEAQWDEWKELFHIDEEQADLFTSGKSRNDRRIAFLKAHPTLVLDTRRFDQDFRDRFLAGFDDLDGMTDGLLIHSENFQAIGLLVNKYREAVRATYIDPPYNTFATKIIYKNEYEHSSWLSLLENRLLLSKRVLGKNAITCTTIDDYELHRLLFVMERVFGADNHLATVAIRNNPSGRSTVKGFAINHEYGLFFSRSSADALVGRMPHTQSQKERYDESDDAGKAFEWENFRKSSAGSYRFDRPRQYFPLYYDQHSKSLRIPRLEWQEATRTWKVLEGPVKTEATIWPKDSAGRERVWRYGIERTLTILTEARVEESAKGCEVYTRKYLQTRGSLPRTWWDKAEYSARDNGTRALADLFGSEKPFDFPKAPAAVMDCIRVCCPGEGGLVLDYFAGSGTTGHAVINLNREDDEGIRFILVEVSEYFDSVLLPRIKKVTFSPEWKEGKPVRRATAEETERSPRIVKVIRLESYEDALNNLADPAPTAEQAKALAENPDLREDYMLHYMLDVETRGTPSLLSIDAFTDPTAYQLKVKKPGTDEYVWKNVDLLETFNYLLGVRVEHMAAPQTFTAAFERPKDPELPQDQRTRLTLKGKLKQDAAGPWWFRKVEGWAPRDPHSPNNGDREKVLIVWRKLTGDLEKDNLVLDAWFEANRISTRDWEFDTIYVNGSNNLPNLLKEGDTWKVRLIEEDFHRLMWDVEDV